MAAISGGATALDRGGSAHFHAKSMKRTASDGAPFVFGRLAAFGPFNNQGVPGRRWRATHADATCAHRVGPSDTPGKQARHDRNLSLFEPLYTSFHSNARTDFCGLALKL